MKDRIETAAEIVAAYVSKNALPSHDLPMLISSVFKRLEEIATPKGPEPLIAEFVPVTTAKKSVQRDHLVCLACAKHFRTLRRHLKSDHQLTPPEYRERYRLPSDYPMVAPAYSERRSELAKTFGLGRVVEPAQLDAKSTEAFSKEKTIAKENPQAKNTVRSHPKAEQTRRKNPKKEEAEAEAA